MNPPSRIPAPARSAAAIQRVQRHINDNLNQALSLTELAELAGLSIWRFATVFRQQVGVSPHRYICRLEDEVDGPVEAARARQVACRAQQHGGVPVVPAAVVDAGEAADIRPFALFEDGQRVHVGAQAHAAPRGAGAQHADDTGAAYAFKHLQPQFAQGRGDDAGRAVLLERKLRMRVQVAPQRDQIRQQVRNLPGHWKAWRAARGWLAAVRYCPGVMPNTVLKCRERWLWS
jgi:hypothetical protein